VIIMTAFSSTWRALSVGIPGGAFEYLPKPFDVDKAVELIRAGHRPRVGAPKPALARRAHASEIMGQAPAMQEVFRAIGRLPVRAM
jgi:two-component system nitrogen regulation response regulator GlnG